MSALLDTVGKITGILGKISELTSSYNESMRLMGGLSGALAVLTEFIQRRVGEDNEVDPQAMRSMVETLDAIEGKIDEIHALLGKRWLCVPYGKWYVYGSPLLAPCAGRIGSTKIIKQLNDLQGDLDGDIKFLELQMMANAVRSLSDISNVQAAIIGAFRNREARGFWISSFGESFAVGQNALAERLVGVVRETRDVQNDSGKSKSATLCAYVAACLARAAEVDVRAFADAVGEGPVEALIEGAVGGAARSVLVPGHYGPVTCLCSKGGFLVSGGRDGTVKVFALSESGVPVLRSTLVGHNDAVTCVDVCDSEALVVSGSSDGFIRTWSLYGGEEVDCFSVVSGVRSVSCTASEIVYACEGPAMSINVRDARSGRIVSKMYGHAGGVTSLAADGGTVFSSGADRAVRKWSIAGNASAAAVPQAHSVAIKFVVRHPEFVASVSNRDVRFYAADDLADAGARVRLCENTAGRGEVRGACALRGRACVVLATSEPFAEAANARLHAVYPGAGQGAGHHTPVRTDPGESPVSVASGGDAVYVGFSSGAVRWYALEDGGFVLRGEVGSAVRGTNPVLAEAGSALPLLANRGESVASAHPPDVVTFHGSGRRRRLPGPATALSATETEDAGWAVGCGGRLLVYDAAGENERAFGVEGEIAHVLSSPIRQRMFLDSRKKPNVRTISVFDSATGEANDLVNEPCPASKTCAPCLVLDDRYLVWPGYFDGTLSVLDTMELRSFEPVGYSRLEVDPVSDIASSRAWFVTLHGKLDTLLWNGVKEGPSRRLNTFRDPVASLAVSPGGGKLVAGCSDGTVHVEDEETETYVDHSLGPVSVVVAGDSTVYSMGAEGSLVRRVIN